MELESSLPHSQEPATCPYTQPDWSSPCLPSQFSKLIFILSSHLCLGLSSVLLPSGFPTKILCTSLLPLICVTCPARLSLLDFIEWCLVRSADHKAPCYVVFSILSLTSKYPPQHPILENPQSMILPQFEWPRVPVNNLIHFWRIESIAPVWLLTFRLSSYCQTH